MGHPKKYLDGKIDDEGYEAWVRNRAKRLAEVGNEFLVELAPSQPAG